MPSLFDQLLMEPDLLGADQLKELKRLPESSSPDPRALGKVLLQRGWLTRYQINEVASGRGKGLRIGPYLLLERLGEGGMGQVFKACHQHMDRSVALKLMRKEKLSNPDSVRRFYQEVKAAAALIHPNIVLAYDAGQAGNTHFFSMELVDGPDLSRLVKERGPLPLAQACEHLRQAAVGLQHAHERGLVHRDIKPSNLLVTTGGGKTVVKILDLGLARLGDSVAQETGLTRMGQVLGTPDYLAPEQALDARRVDIRVDIYSLGCSLFFLLTGSPPFRAEALAQLLLKHQVEKPPSVRALRPDVPEGLDILMQRMMAKKPEHRPGTPAEVVSALAAFAGGGGGGGGGQAGSRRRAVAVPVRPLPPPPAPEDAFAALCFEDAVAPATRSGARPRGRDDTVDNSPRRRRDGEKKSNVPVLIGAGVVLLGGAALAAVLLLSAGNRDPKNEDTGGDSQGKKHDPPDDEDKPRPTPPVGGSARGPIQGQPGPGAPILLAGHTEPVRALGVAPNGQLAASGGLDRSVIVWDLARAKELRRFDALPGEVWSLRFAPDNRRLFASAGNSLIEWDVTSGKRLGKERSPSGHLSPDCQTLLSFDSQAGSPETRFLNVANMRVVGREVGLQTGPFRVSFDRAGENALAFGEGPEGLHLDLVGRSVKGRLRGVPNQYDIYSTCWVPGVNQVLLGGTDGSIWLLDLDAARRAQRIGATHEGTVRSIDVSPDGKQVLSTCDNLHVYLTDVEKRTHAGTFTAHRARPNKVLFCPGGKRAISAGEDNRVVLWDLERPTALVPPVVPPAKQVPVRNSALRTFPAPPVGAGAPPVVVNRTPGPLARIPVLPMPKGKVNPWAGHKGKVNSLVFSRNGKLLLSAGTDGTAKLWDTSNGALVSSFKNNNGAIHLARFARRDRNILAIGDGQSAHYWKVDPPNDEVLLPYPGKAPATCGDVSYDGKHVLLAGADVVKTFTLGGGKVKEAVESQLRGPDGAALGNATCIVALGEVARGAPQFFAIGTSSGMVCLWNVAYPQPDGMVKGQVVQYWQNHENAVLGLACHTSTRMLASVSADRSIVVRSYDPKKLKTFVSAGEEVRGRPRRPRGHDEEVTSVDFSPGGEHVVTGGRDRKVRFWTHKGAMLQLTPIAINGEVLGVACSPDGKRLAVCSNNPSSNLRMYSLEK
jgi:WD40 repeat protein